MADTTTYDDVKGKVESMGYILLSNEYIKPTSPLLLRCPKHGDFVSKWSDIKRGHGCRDCGIESSASARSYSIDYVRDYIESNTPYTLISDKYEGANEDIKVNCPIHGEFITSFSCIKNGGHKCPDCARDEASKKLAMSFQDVKRIVEGRGYKLLDDTYKNQRTKMKMLCPAHGVFYLTMGKMIQRNQGCPTCSKERVAKRHRGSNNPTWAGGHRSLYRSLRELTKPWKIRQFVRTKGLCEVTGVRGRSGNIEVHHMTSFISIVDKTFKELNLDKRSCPSDYTQDEWEKIENKLLENNEKLSNPVVMLKTVHREFHKFCGGTTKPTSFEQLEKFKKAIMDGKINIQPPT